MSNWQCITGLLFFIFSEISSSQIISLDNFNWTVRSADKAYNLEAKIPGGIYTDLRRSNILQEDILFRFNDKKYRWVSKTDWYFETFFDCNGELSELASASLIFQGIDTVSEIWFNNVLIGKTDNMFVQYRFPIGSHIKTENNKLVIKIFSPVMAAKKIAESLPHVVPLECWPESYNGECHINKLRKMQASFAWDWGPAFPSMGLWKSVFIDLGSEPLIFSVGTDVQKIGNQWIVHIKAWFDHQGSSIDGTLFARLHLKGKYINNQIDVPDDKENSILKQATIQLAVDEEDVELWWPNGYGEQPLYDLEVSWKGAGNNYQIKFLKVAFREFQVVQDPVSREEPKKGLTFYFKVNGLAIFAKGSNWIPSDILPERSANKSRINYLLESAKAAHFNMLRVWGGGYYESDYFYEECDRLGIMLWQDLMFACNMYPATEDFLDNVKTEIAQQIARIQHHPSLVIYSLNNENEVALRQNWYDTKSQFDLFQKEYIILYANTILPTVEKLDQSRTVLMSSPSNGPESVKENYIATNPQDSLYGDVHYYNYLSDLWMSSIYPRARFVSEYGVQSLPSYSTLKSASTSDDLVWNSTWLASRQHKAGGYDFLTIQMSFNLPKPSDLQETIYYSQIHQAVAIQTETECYRRQRSTLYSTGEGLTMGALYWQLLDIWQAPSWSSIDYSGKWKMLHYYAVKFFAPVIISPYVTPDGRVSVYVVSDLQEPIQNVVLEIFLYSSRSLIPLYRKTKADIEVKANQADEIYTEDLSELLKGSRGANESFLKFSIGTNSEKSIAPVGYIFPEKIKNMVLPSTTVTISDFEMKSDLKIHLSLTTTAPAFFVWLDAGDIDGIFSDNGFHMTSSSYQITFTFLKPPTLNVRDFVARISINHLAATY